MKELFQHIERLLTGHDCVVVPGLGGFVLHEVPFSTGEDGSIFHPGGKEISFNIRLTFNDGILVQTYQEAHQLTFEAAVETIREQVAAIHATLDQGQVLPVGRLGTLRKNEDGQVLFRPDNRNLYCPQCYGLSSFVFQTLEQRTRVVPKQRKSRKKKDEYIHIRFHRHTISQLLTGAAACLLLLLVSRPAGELKQYDTQEAFLLREYFTGGMNATLPITASAESTYVTTESTTVAVAESTGKRSANRSASTGTSRKARRLLPSTDDIDSLFGLITSITSSVRNSDSAGQKSVRTRKNDSTLRQPNEGTTEDPAIQPTEKKASRKALTPKKNKLPLQSLPRQKNPSAQTGGKTYCIIISSHPSKSVAQQWLNDHKNGLYEQANIIEGDGRARVSINHFSNKQEAETFLRQFRKENPQYADAWLLPATI